MRSKLIISAFVLIMGVIITVSPSFILSKFYFSKGDVVTAAHVTSNKTSNARDTVMIPTYTFTRNIPPLVQNCTLPFLKYAHALDGKPKYPSLELKVLGKCDDYVILNDPPYEQIPLLIIGFIMMLLGALLFLKTLQSVKKK